MRSTVDIPDALYRKLKSKAAVEGRSVGELIFRGIKAELRRQARRYMSLPLVPSKNPGTRVLDNAKIFELIPFP